MKGFSEEVRQDKIIFWGALITFLIILLSLIFILFYLKSLPPYIPIYNQLPWGEERLGPTLIIFLPVSLAALFSIINIFISSIIYSKSQIISRMLTVASTLISFLSFLFIIRTIQLIT